MRRDAFQLLTRRAAAPGEAERRLRAWHGEGAAEHLFLTAAGLDSACVGEIEILGQVRHAQERSLELGLCGPTLGLVFEEALRIAGRVHGGTKLAEGRVSLAEIAVEGASAVAGLRRRAVPQRRDPVRARAHEAGRSSRRRAESPGERLR